MYFYRFDFRIYQFPNFCCFHMSIILLDWLFISSVITLFIDLVYHLITVVFAVIRYMYKVLITYTLVKVYLINDKIKKVNIRLIIKCCDISSFTFYMLRR